MNTFLSKMSGIGYKYVAKPVLFRIPPDTAHKIMITAGSLIQRSKFARRIVHGAWAAKPHAALRQKIHGITFANPVGLSAGFDKNIELAPLMKSVGFGFMEGGTITRLPYGGNVRPWFYRLPKSKSLVVHVGLANQGVHAVLRRIKKYPRDTFTHFPLNVSVGSTNGMQGATAASMVRDCTETITAVHQSRSASMITLNISCPNIHAGEVFTNPQHLDLLLGRVDALRIAEPVFLKMPSDITMTEFDALLAVAARHKVAGITVCNLTKNRRSEHIIDALPTSVKGGLSGRPTFDLSNKLIRHAYQTYGDRFTIIGVGGIFSAEDAYIKIKLGASLVELITGMIYEGPQLVGKINTDLAEMLRRDGFTSVKDAIGSGIK